MSRINKKIAPLLLAVSLVNASLLPVTAATGKGTSRTASTTTKAQTGNNYSKQILDAANEAAGGFIVKAGNPPAQSSTNTSATNSPVNAAGAHSTQNTTPSTQTGLNTATIKEISGGGMQISSDAITVPQTAERLDKLAKLSQEGQALVEKKELDKALVKFQEAYGLALEMKYEDGQGRALTDMCRLYQERGQSIKAKELGENALELLSNGSDKRSVARARIALAQAYLSLDNSFQAAQQLELAIKSFAGIESSDAGEAAKVLVLVGSILLGKNKIKDGLQAYHVAATYYSQAGNRKEEINLRNGIASLMQELGFFTAAKEEAMKSLVAANDLKDPSYQFASLATLANCQYALGEFAESRNNFLRALLLQVKPDSANTSVSIQLGFGLSLLSTGNAELSKQYIEPALKLLRSNGTAAKQSMAINALANAEYTLGNYARATQLFREASELSLIANQKQAIHPALLLQNLAASEYASGNARGAKATLQSAMSQLGKRTADKLLQGRIYTSMTETCLKMKDLTKAQEYLDHAIQISQSIQDDAALWRDYTNLALLQKASGQNDLCKESLSSAISFFRSPQAGAFANSDFIPFIVSRQEAGQQLVSLLIASGMTEQALSVAEQLKEEAVINDWQRLSGEVKPQDKELYTDLSEQRAHLHSAELISTPDKLSREWRDWLSRFKLLSEENPALARLIAPVPMPITDLIATAKNKRATILDYYLGPNSTFVFTITNNGDLSANVLPFGANDAKRRVSALLKPPVNETVAAQEKRILSALHNDLLPPQITAGLPSDPEQTLIIIPDGALFNLPFAALLDAQGKYLIESHTLTIAPAMAALLGSPSPYTDGIPSLIAMAATNGEKKAADSDLLSSVFAPEELSHVSADLGEMDALQEQAKAKSTLHFSTSCAISDINPLSTVLASAPSKDKAPLTVDKLFTLSLPSDLAVWSNSAIDGKDLRGSGLQIWSRGLNYAGVRNVLFSLWSTPIEQHNAELTDFYKSKKEGLSEAQSLRKAQIQSLSKDPSPRSWAAFQLVGPGY